MRILRAGLIALASLAAVGALAGTLSAQGSGNPTILQAVQALQGTVNSLSATIDALVTTVNGINTSITPGNVRFTPATQVAAPDSVACVVTNVSAVTHTVNLELLSGGGGFPLYNVPQTVFPGGSLGISFAPVATSLLSCKFTVTDGTKNDILGSLIVYAGATTAKVVVATQ